MKPRNDVPTPTSVGRDSEGFVTLALPSNMGPVKWKFLPDGADWLARELRDMARRVRSERER